MEDQVMEQEAGNDDDKEETVSNRITFMDIIDNHPTTTTTRAADPVLEEEADEAAGSAGLTSPPPSTTTPAPTTTTTTTTTSSLGALAFEASAKAKVQEETDGTTEKNVQEDQQLEEQFVHQQVEEIRTHKATLLSDNDNSNDLRERIIEEDAKVPAPTMQMTTFPSGIPRVVTRHDHDHDGDNSTCASSITLRGPEQWRLGDQHFLHGVTSLYPSKTLLTTTDEEQHYSWPDHSHHHADATSETERLVDQANSNHSQQQQQQQQQQYSEESQAPLQKADLDHILQSLSSQPDNHDICPSSSNNDATTGITTASIGASTTSIASNNHHHVQQQQSLKAGSLAVQDEFHSLQYKGAANYIVNNKSDSSFTKESKQPVHHPVSGSAAPNVIDNASTAIPSDASSLLMASLSTHPRIANNANTSTGLGAAAAHQQQQPGAFAEAGPFPEYRNNRNVHDNQQPASQDDQQTSLSIEATATATATATTELAQASLVPEPRALPVAESVNDDDGDGPIISATPKRFFNTNHRKGLGIALIVGIIVVMISIITSISVVATNQNRNDNNNDRDIYSDREITIQSIILRALSSKTVVYQYATAEDQDLLLQQQLQDPDSHMGRALRWILFDDPMKLPANATNLIQRFFVAYFYHATTEQGPWASCNPPSMELVQDDNRDLFCSYDGLMDDGPDPYWSIWPTSFAQMMAAPWLTNHHECQWAGLFCNNKSKIELLHLDKLNLSGTIPEQLFLLDDLRSLSVSSNELYGNLPTALATLRHVEFADFRQNQFSGRIPHEWWGTGLDHNNNQTGTSANATLVSMEKLRDLKLSSNPLDEWTIPPSIRSAMPNLENLHLDGSRITGTLPTELFGLTNIREFWVRENDFYGTLPSEIGLLTLLEYFSFHSTFLSGSLPTEIALLTNMVFFDTWDTKMGGSFPEEMYLADYQQLKVWILNDCSYTGTISTNIGRLSTIEFIYLSENPGLVGTIPTEVGLLTNLEKIHFHDTRLTGTMPEELCALRGDKLLQVVKADCMPMYRNNTNGTANASVVIPITCPYGCCTKCCHQETLECETTGS